MNTCRHALAGAMALALYLGTLPAGASDDKIEAIQDQLRTFSRILNVTLEQKKLQADGPWAPGRSPFDAGVEVNYVPTVGAIFTVPVEFPIVEPDTPDAGPQRPELDLDQDLWDRFSRDRRRSAFTPPSVFGPPDAEREVRRQVERELRGVDPENFGRAINVIVGQSLFEGERSAYNAEKVDKLRHVILSTLGKYGHRLEGIPEGERILIVVEAPKTEKREGFRSPRPGRDDDGDRDDRAGREPRGTRDREDAGRPWSDRDGGRQGGMFFRSSDARDRLLFSIEKSALTGEMTASAIRPAVKELPY